MAGQRDTGRRRNAIGVAAFLAVAAAAVLVLYLSSSTEPPPPDPGRQLGAQLVAFYDHGPELGRADGGNCFAEGIEPTFVPDDSVEVRGECGSMLTPACEGIAAARMLQLRLRPAGPEVLVCVEPLAKDPHPVLPADSELHLHRRVLGEFVLYEITPLPEPRALEFFWM
jgi:hypothetical protein